MIVLEMDQRSIEWHAARIGIPTASAADQIVTPVKGDLSKSAEPYIAQLLCELRGIHDPPEQLMVKHIQDGIFMEDEALASYEFDTGNTARIVGMVARDDGMVACSPDALVTEPSGDQGGFEGKAPTSKVHMLRLMRGGLPPEVKPQVHMSLVISRLPFWDFQSYYAGLDPLIVRVTPDDYTERVSVALDQFMEMFGEAADKQGIALKSLLEQKRKAA